jgi:hypothetical protein
MNGDGGHIVPLGGNPPPAVDQGQVADGQTQSSPDQPSGSATAKPSKTPKPSGSGTPVPAPTPTVGVTSPGAPPPPPPPTFSPISVEAESATLGGGAQTSTRCTTCSRGTEVRFIGGTGSSSGTVTFSGLRIPTAATYHLTIAYVLGDAPRSFFVSVNGGAATEVACSDFSAGWQAPKNRIVDIVLPAGTDSIRFANSGADAPDLDKITLGP